MRKTASEIADQVLKTAGMAGTAGRLLGTAAKGARRPGVAFPLAAAAGAGLGIGGSKALNQVGENTLTAEDEAEQLRQLFQQYPELINTGLPGSNVPSPSAYGEMEQGYGYPPQYPPQY